MKRREFLATTAVAGTALGLGFGRAAFAQDPLKVGFIYVGVPGLDVLLCQHEKDIQDM